MKLLLLALPIACLAAHANKRRRIVRQEEVYDRSITTFDPDGRLLQVEYAGSAVKSDIVGVTRNGYTYICTTKGTTLHRISDTVWLAISGLASDADYSVGWLRQTAQNHRITTDQELTVRQASEKLAGLLHEFSFTQGARPVAVAALCCGPNSLWRVELAGNVLDDCHVAAVGPNSRKILEQFDVNDNDTSHEAVIRKLVKLVGDCSVWILTPERLACLQGVTKGTAIADVVAKLDL